MALFGYKGVNASGSSVKGSMEAATARDLKTLLKKDSVFLTDFWEMGAEQLEKESFSLSTSVSLRPGGGISQVDMTTVTRQLATLTRAGIPLVESLSAVIEQADKPPLKVMLTGIRKSVNEGESLADALSKYPKHFTNIYINMVNAGEQSGTLELVLERLAEFMESQAKIKSKIISAMAYPIIMLVIGTAILGVMMGVVVPKVAVIFDDFGQQLPWFTRAMIFTSKIVSGYWWLLIPCLIIIVAAFLLWKKSDKGKPQWHKIMLRLPVFGELILMLAMGRFARTLGTMLSSGVQMLRSLEITKHILGNMQLEEVIDGSIVAVREGVPLNESIQKSLLFPPLVTRMIAIGEKSGQLESMLTNVAEFYESRTDAKIVLLTSMLEPILILVMGLGAGSVAFSILWPILKMNQFVT